jgi:hypothetical protein
VRDVVGFNQQHDGFCSFSILREAAPLSHHPVNCLKRCQRRIRQSHIDRPLHA